jgi:hypothetical protein
MEWGRALYLHAPFLTKEGRKDGTVIHVERKDCHPGRARA